MQNYKAFRPPTTQMSLAFHRDHLHVTHATACRWNCSCRTI